MYDPYHPIKPHFSQKTLRYNVYHRSSRSEVFLKKGVLKICSKFNGEHPRQNAISLRHGCSPVHSLHIF